MQPQRRRCARLLTISATIAGLFCTSGWGNALAASPETPAVQPGAVVENSTQSANESGSNTGDEAENRTSTSVPDSAVESASAAEDGRQDRPSGDQSEAEGVKETEAVKHYELGGFYFRKWDLDLAAVELDEAVMYWPDFKAAHRDLCLVSLFQVRPLRALAELMMVIGLGDPIPLNENERADLNRRAWTLHYNKGVDQAKHSRWKDAVAEFGWALSYAPNDARIHHSLAFAHANMGEFDAAEKQYAESFALDPSDAYAHADLATLLAEEGQRDKAAGQMSEAVKLAPAAAALHVDLGWMAESHGDFDTAGQEFRNAIHLSPKHAGLWAHLGQILERQGKSQEALDAYKQALAIDPGHDQARERLAKLMAQAHS